MQPRADRLRASLSAIVGERHHRTSPEHHARTRELIASTLTETGFAVRQQVVRGPHGAGANVIGTKRGRPGATSWIVGAHYDTVCGTPGADDNGIAVAGLLELAVALASVRPRDTIELVAWDMEEFQTDAAPGLIGSGVMAAQARVDGRSIAGVIDLEMIGLCRKEAGSQRFPTGFGLLYPKVAAEVGARGSRGDFIAAIVNPEARSLAGALHAQANDVALPFVTLEIKGHAKAIHDFFRSDHAPFWAHGYPAVMLTDTAEFRSGHYHRETDTIETIDFDFAARVVSMVEGALRQLAGEA